MKICDIEDCDRAVIAKGLCNKHYLRQYRHGDPGCVAERKDYALRGREHPGHKHGLWNHPLYKTWGNMMSRCYNPNYSSYAYYGGRGIKVCERWRSVANFIADMSPRPLGASLERKDGNEDYSPRNCVWVPRADQARNRSNVKASVDMAARIRREPRRGVNGRGDGQTIAEIAEKYGVSVWIVKRILGGHTWAD